MARNGDTLTAEDVKTLEGLLAKLSGPGADLPWALFRFVTEVAATANVDLLVQDRDRGVLLAWRDDPFGAGWHVPGSIVRHREQIAHRVAACARDELGCEVDADLRAAALVEIFDDRGHSVSICYRASLRGEPGRRVVGEGDAPEPGDLRWFRAPPPDLYPSHRVYRDVLHALGPGAPAAGEPAAGAPATGAPLFTQHVGRRDAAQASPEGEIGGGVPLA